MLWLLQNTLIAAVLAALVVLICRFKRIGPAARHVLWLVVLIKLVTPPLVFWPWPVPQLSEMSYTGRITENQQSAERKSRLDGESSAPSVLNTPDENDVIVSNEWLVVPVEAVGTNDIRTIESAEPQQKQSSQAEQPMSPVTGVPAGIAASTLSWWEKIPWRTVTGLLWLTGSAFVLLVNLYRIVRMNRHVGRGSPAAGWLDWEVKHWAEQLRLSMPEVVSVGCVSSPMVWAPFRPRLLWPAALSAETDAVAWRGVIVHELAHIKRKDHWVAWVEMLARCLWWWNPLFWCVRHQVRENAELACDAWVVETLPDGRRAYAEALLTVCETMSQTAPLPAIGIGSGDRRNLERRLTMILKERVPFQVSRFAMFAVVVLGLLTLPGWTQSTPQKNAAQNTPPETAAEGSGSVIEDELKPAETEASSNPFRDSPTLNPDRLSIDPNSGTIDGTSNIAAQEGKGEVSSSPPRIAPVGTPNTVRPRNRVDQVESGRAPPTTSSAKRIQVLEQQLRQLQQEIKNLRSRNSIIDFAGNIPFVQTQRPANEAREPVASDSSNDEFGGLSSQEPVQDGRIVATRTITLQRTTYRLPAEQSQALATFLKMHVKAEVLTISIAQGFFANSKDRRYAVAEPTISITTTPEVQKVIGGLILIMRKDAPEKLPRSVDPRETFGDVDSSPEEAGDATTIRRRQTSTSGTPVEVTTPTELPESDTVPAKRSSERFDE